MSERGNVAAAATLGACVLKRATHIPTHTTHNTQQNTAHTIEASEPKQCKATLKLIQAKIAVAFNGTLQLKAIRAQAAAAMAHAPIQIQGYDNNGPSVKHHQPHPHHRHSHRN